MAELNKNGRSIRVSEETYEKLRELAFRKKLKIKEVVKKLVDKAK